LRLREWLLLAGFAAAMIVVGYLGRRAAPDASLGDYRASTYLTGPDGLSALAETLEAFGVAVERRRIPLFGITDDLTAKGPGTVLAVVDPSLVMTSEERREVTRYLEAGGAVVLAGWTGVEWELGLARRAVGDSSDYLDTAAVVPPAGIGPLPGVSMALRRRRPTRDAPILLEAERIDTLLAAGRRRPVALRMEFPGGGRALVLAEPDWLRNRALRDTDVGALVVPWLLSLGVERLVVDEYHHGFGRSGALVGAVWQWLISRPPGWALLQLAVAALAALAVLAVRFGPAVTVISRRRRSPMEHLEALASGLERADGRAAATALLGRGLARRLRRVGHAVPRAAWAREREQWLAGLARGSDHPATRAAVTRLGWLLRERGEGGEHVLRTAQAVEDVWEVLKRPSSRAPS
jgi:hypothetical protein